MIEMIDIKFIKTAYNFQKYTSKSYFLLQSKAFASHSSSSGSSSSASSIPYSYESAASSSPTSALQKLLNRNGGNGPA